MQQFYSPFLPPEPARTIIAPIERDLLREIDILAAKTNHTRSEIINLCLEYSLRHLEIVDPE